MADKCPRCDKKYEKCRCGSELTRTKAKRGPVTALAVLKAAKACQDLGLPLTTGSVRPDVERDMSISTIAKGNDKDGD